jgi:hypothetical protein
VNWTGTSEMMYAEKEFSGNIVHAAYSRLTCFRIDRDDPSQVKRALYWYRITLYGNVDRSVHCKAK